MRKKAGFLYVSLLAILLLVMIQPLRIAESLRGRVVALLAPLWQLAGREPGVDTQVERLELENQRLRDQISRLSHLLKVESAAAQALPAQVIFRAPDSWNSSLWLNVGQSDNEAIGQVVVAKNSPVVVGVSLIGVIDYVGQKQSRVRLITDSALAPSVRAARGGIQRQHLLQQVDTLAEGVAVEENLFSSAEERHHMLETLLDLRALLTKPQSSFFLAKGELQGSGFPIWRRPGDTLKGIGFNYDFADDEGPARDLRTGQISGSSDTDSAVPIIKVGDLLVTTGLDGVFPEGLEVARVTVIAPLREGDYFYELEAKPTAGSLDTLSWVFVLPPFDFEPEGEMRKK